MDSSSAPHTSASEGQSNIEKAQKPYKPKNFTKEIAELDSLFDQALHPNKYVQKSSQLSDEEKEISQKRKVIVEQMVREIHIDTRPERTDIQKQIKNHIIMLRGIPELRPEDIDHIIGVNLMGEMLEEGFGKRLDEKQMHTILRGLAGREPENTGLANKLTYCNAYKSYQSIDVVDFVGDYDEQVAKREMEEQAADGDDDVPIDLQKLEQQKREEEEKKALEKKRNSAHMLGTQKTQDSKTDSKKRLTRGTLTRDMDLEFGRRNKTGDMDIAEMMTSRSFDLKYSSLKRIIREWSLNQFNKSLELLAIAVYLLAYFLKIPPFFPQSSVRGRLTESQMKELHIKEFLVKTTAFNIQLMEGNPLLKIYYPRLMEKAGWDIINERYEVDSEKDEEDVSINIPMVGKKRQMRHDQPRV